MNTFERSSSDGAVIEHYAGELGETIDQFRALQDELGFVATGRLVEFPSGHVDLHHQMEVRRRMRVTDSEYKFAELDN